LFCCLLLVLSIVFVILSPSLIIILLGAKLGPLIYYHSYKSYFVWILTTMSNCIGGGICLLVVIFFFFFCLDWGGYGHEEFFLFRGVGGLVFCLCAFGSNG
jgi:hypothetical protein